MKLMGICFATSIMTSDGLKTKITEKHELPNKEGFDHNWVLKAIQEMSKDFTKVMRKFIPTI